MIRPLLFLLLLFSFQTSFSQKNINGIVTDENDLPLYSATLVLKDTTDAIKAYTYTDKEGLYMFKNIQAGEYTLTLSNMGFKTEQKHLKITGETDHILDFKMQEESLMLGEVFIHSQSPITVKKDTISFLTKFFTDGTEHNVEDLLKKIPGLEIDTEGKISVAGREIEKLMIDGDDFFSKGYSALSKNMPAHPIEEVEILERYSNNPLLKGIEQSDKVALNLKLNDESKRVWFGNAQATLGNDEAYYLSGNLMNFGKKNKYYFLSNLNNIGYDAIGSVNSLIHSSSYGEAGSIGDDQSLYPMIGLYGSSLGFSRSKTNFNNAKLVSLNAIFNPTEKLKIKPIAFFNWDSNDFYRNSLDVTHTEEVSFTNTEDYILNNKKKIAFGKLDLNYDISKTKKLESSTRYNNARDNANSDLVFNDNSTVENLKSKGELFDQKINYSNRFKDNKVFLLTGRYLREKSPQDYAVNQFFFHDLFPEIDKADGVAQAIHNEMQYAGVQAHLLDRRKNKDLLEVKIGNELREDKILTDFSIYDDNINILNSEAYQNRTKYLSNDFYIKTSFRKKIQDFSISGKLNLHQLYNRLENKEELSQQNKLFVTPEITLGWEIDEANQIMAGYSYNMTNASALNVYDSYIMRGYRSFTKGYGEITQLNNSKAHLNYRLGKWNSRFLANANIIYTKDHDYFTSSSALSQNHNQSAQILVKDREMLLLNTSLDYYLVFLRSNIKAKLGHVRNNYKNIINNSDWRKIESKNYTYGLELKSGFNGFFNFHLGTEWIRNEIKTNIKYSYTDNLSFLDLNFIYSSRFYMTLKGERYKFGSLNSSDKAYYFLNFNANYGLIEKKLNLGIIGNNLVNTKKFINASTTDIGTYTTEYRLLPRHVLLKIEYRF